MGNTPAVDELGAIRSHAAALGLPEPHVRRFEAAVNGVKMSGLQWGDTPPELVFLHGAQLNAHTWNSAILRLGRPALALDLPGHGRSGRLPRDHYRVSSMAEYVRGALESAGALSGHLVAHSFGSFVGALVAEQLTGFQRFTILDAVPHRLGTPKREKLHVGTLEELAASIDPNPDVNITSGQLRPGLYLNTQLRPDGLYEWLWDEEFPKASSARRGEQEAVWNALSRFGGKLTLLRGDRGGVQASEAKDFLRRTPGSTVTEVPNAGHNVHTDAAEWLADWLDQQHTPDIPATPAGL